MKMHYIFVNANAAPCVFVQVLQLMPIGVREGKSKTNTEPVTHRIINKL